MYTALFHFHEICALLRDHGAKLVSVEVCTPQSSPQLDQETFCSFPLSTIMNCSQPSTFFATPRFQLLGFHSLTVLGTPLHLFGGYCILTKTSHKNNNLRWVLLQLHILTFSLDIALNFFTAPFLTWPCVMGYPMGLMTSFGMPTDVLSYFTISLVAILGAGITLLFEFRFNALLGNSIWKYARLLFHTFNFTFASTFLTPQYLYFVPKNQREALGQCGFFPCNEPIPSSAFALSGPILFLSLTICSLATYLFLACGFFTIRLHYFVIKHQSMSECTKRMQKKLQVALVSQCAIPVAAMGVPIGLMSVFILGGMHSQAINNITMLMLASHGTLATIVMILVHEPYKKFAMDLIFKMKLPLIASDFLEPAEPRFFARSPGIDASTTIQN